MSMNKGMGERVAKDIASGGARERTDTIVNRLGATENPVRFDRTFDSAAWPTSTPARPVKNPMKVTYKHDSAPGEKE